MRKLKIAYFDFREGIQTRLCRPFVSLQRSRSKNGTEEAPGFSLAKAGRDNHTRLLSSDFDVVIFDDPALYMVRQYFKKAKKILYTSRKKSEIGDMEGMYEDIGAFLPKQKPDTFFFAKCLNLVIRSKKGKYVDLEDRMFGFKGSIFPSRNNPLYSCGIYAP